jgi:hypothetical protein
MTRFELEHKPGKALCTSNINLNTSQSVWIMALLLQTKSQEALC